MVLVEPTPWLSTGAACSDRFTGDRSRRIQPWAAAATASICLRFAPPRRTAVPSVEDGLLVERVGVIVRLDPEGTVAFDVDEELLEVEELLAGGPVGTLEFVRGVRSAAAAGCLRTVDDLRAALADVERVLGFGFEWPAEWGPVTPGPRQAAAAVELEQTVRSVCDAAVLILRRSRRADVSLNRIWCGLGP